MTVLIAFDAIHTMADQSRFACFPVAPDDLAKLPAAAAQTFRIRYERNVAPFVRTAAADDRCKCLIKRADDLIVRTAADKIKIRETGR